MPLKSCPAKGEEFGAKCADTDEFSERRNAITIKLILQQKDSGGEKRKRASIVSIASTGLSKR